MISNHTISLCMIVKNEERSLERCLQSVQGKVGEIIIVDTGSTDQTKEIARRYTDRIYDFKWIGDFSAARNYALEFASSDYILHLDADETLEDPNNELIGKLDKDFYYIRIKNDLGTGLVLTHQFVRLFKNSPEIRYKGALHEQVQLDHNTHQYGYLSTVILHDGYKDDIIKSKQKAQRNEHILLQEIKNNPTAFNYYNLGMQYIVAAQYNDALNALKKSYTLANNYTFSQKVVLEIVKCLHELGRYQEAVKVSMDAVELYENIPDFWYQLGLSYLEWGLLKDAEECFNKCLEIGEERSQELLNHYDGTGSYLAQGQLAKVNLMLGDNEQALEYILLAAKAAPNVTGLFNIFVSILPNASAKELLQNVIHIWPFQTERHANLIASLYQQRHPLLNEFITYHNLDVEYPISTLHYIFENNYERALAELNQQSQKGTDHFITNNVILLSFLLNNPNLITEFKNDISLSEKEAKWFKFIILKKVPTQSIHVNKALLMIWKQLIMDLIQLQKYEFIDLLISATKQAEFRLIISECLQQYGFDELALEVLIECDNSHVNRQVYMTAAKSLIKLGAAEDALFYLNKAEGVHLDFNVLFEKWRIVSTIDKFEEIKILQRMIQSYPESRWAKRTSGAILG